MPISSDNHLLNYLFAQKSVTKQMPYDVIEKIIHDSIDYVKKENINARISNVVLNINNKLVLAQVYVERKNGFALTKVEKYGTTPTSYNVQIRFPHGLETKLGEERLVIPSAQFNNPLKAYKTNVKVCDDVQRDYEAADIILGPGIKKTIIVTAHGNTINLACEPDGHAIELSVENEIGLGFTEIMQDKEYTSLDDYNRRLKKAGVAPLFYFDKNQPHTGLLQQHTYPGFTVQQEGQFESRNNNITHRIKQYQQFLQLFNQQIVDSETGKYWQHCLANTNGDTYLFNINIINGITLFANSGLPITRLRDYQLELFNHCLSFIDGVQQNNQTGMQEALTGLVDMGVGAGKTFFTFTLLQHLKYQMLNNPKLYVAPSFCLTPDAAVADVTKKSINRQGLTTGMTAATLINQSQLPNTIFLKNYSILSEAASREAESIDSYLDKELKEEILDFCNAHSIHPHGIINIIYNSSGYYSNILETYKDSIDPKRLLLMVEGQKTIKNTTGMLGITALQNLLQQFETIKKEIEKRNTEPRNRSLDLFRIPQKEAVEINWNLQINYDQLVRLPRACQGGNLEQLNMANLTEKNLRNLLETKNRHNPVFTRDNLLKIAGLNDAETAILFANSGGLGNTSTNEEISHQINTLLPFATQQITTLAKKSILTPEDHYRMFLFLGSVFSTIPDEINFKQQLRTQNNNRPNIVDDFEKYILKKSIAHHIDLITHIETRIKHKINSISSVKTIPNLEPDALKAFDIPLTQNCIEAANQLASTASLQITGHAHGTNAKLLLTHVPVFTPEGLTCYIEHLGSLENNAKFNFKEAHGIYIAETQGKVTKQDIKNRLEQFLKAIMIADEVHKEEFKFLYDTSHPFYQRINKITQQFLNKEFITVLPHRIGMSGTINDVAKQAFGENTLYKLSTSTMMQQGILKQVNTNSFLQLTSQLDSEQDSYAQQLVINYFSLSPNLSLQNILKNNEQAIDLFSLSKGLIFSKATNEKFNTDIIYLFNLLAETNPSENDKTLQDKLFEKINQKRSTDLQHLQNKLLGNTELSSTELHQISFFNINNNDPITVSNNRLNVNNFQLQAPTLTPQILKKMHIQALQNNLFAIYIEFILSKSTAPKELSDIVGLQNLLFDKGIPLTAINQVENEEQVATYLSLMNSIDPKTITKENVEGFITERIKDEKLASCLIKNILYYFNSHVDFVNNLIEDTQNIDLPHLITDNRDEFEASKAIIMIGGSGERTGYSHEPVGIIIDAPLFSNDLGLIFPEFINKLTMGTLKENDIMPFFLSLRNLVNETYSYNEKNQAGGRALRTTSGHVNYTEYQTVINALLKPMDSNSPLMALKVETDFQDIFTADEEKARHELNSISFNREAITLLEQDYTEALDFYATIRNRFSNELKNPITKQHYQNYIDQRLPLLWAMKYDPNIACTYFLQNNADSLSVFKFPIIEQKAKTKQIFPEPIQPLINSPIPKVGEPNRPEKPVTQSSSVNPLTPPTNPLLHDDKTTSDTPQIRYAKALKQLLITRDALKAQRVKPELLHKISRLVEIVKNLEQKKTSPQNLVTLTQVLTSTNAILTGGDVDPYLELARTVHDKPSSGFKYLGLLMVTIGLLALAAGLAISLSGIGIAAGAGLAGGGTLTSAAGVGMLFFSKANSNRSLEKNMIDITQDLNLPSKK